MIGATFWIVWKDYALSKSKHTPDIVLHHNNIFKLPTSSNEQKPAALLYPTDFFVLNPRTWIALSSWYPGLITACRKIVSHSKSAPSNGLGFKISSKKCLELEVNLITLFFVTLNDKGVPKQDAVLT